MRLREEMCPALLGSMRKTIKNPALSKMHISKGLLILIFLVAFTVRLVFAYIGFVYPDPELPGSDSMRFDTIGLNLSAGKGFAVDGLPATDRAPLYCFFLAATYFLFGHSYPAVIFFQSLIGALTCVFVFGIAGKIFKRDVALLSYILSAIFPPLIGENNFLMSETIYTFLSCATIYSFLKYISGPQLKNAALSGLIFAVGILGRPVLAAQHLLTMCFMFIYNTRLRLKRCFLPVLIFLVSSFVVIAPWVIRNYIVAKKWIFVTEYGGYHFLQASFNDLWFFELADQEEKTEKTSMFIDDGYIGMGYDRGIGGLGYTKLALFNITKSPFRYIKASLKRFLNPVFHSYGGVLGLEILETGRESFSCLKIRKPTLALMVRAILISLYVIIYSYAAIGIFSNRAVINKSAKYYVLSYLGFYLFIIAFATIATARYYTPAYPLLIIFSSAGLRRIR